MKIYVASFNRASDLALIKLIHKMKQEGYYTDNYKDADYILAVGDRVETYDFVLERFKENKKIIHLWAGEISRFEIHDDIYRHSMTLMSDYQLCTNREAMTRVVKLLTSIGKNINARIIGNIMLDNLEYIDDAYRKYNLEKNNYDVILYNPVTRYGIDIVKNDIDYIDMVKSDKYIWIEPNGDLYSDLLDGHVTHGTLPRTDFLGLIKHCGRYITNSSSMYYEAPFLMDSDKILCVGDRNRFRESKSSDMGIMNASDNVIQFFGSLDEKHKTKKNQSFIMEI